MAKIVFLGNFERLKTKLLNYFIIKLLKEKQFSHLAISQFFLFLFTSHISHFTFAQNSTKPNKEYYKSYWSDNKLLLSSPARWEIKDVWKAYLFAGAVYLLTTKDEAIHEFFQKNKTDATVKIAQAVSPLGNELVVLGIEGGWYALNLLRKNEHSQALALTAVKTTLLSGMYIFTVKHLTHRSRPFQEHNPNQWKGPGNDWEFTSFPSGHATFSFGLATVISSASKNKWISAGSYALASLIAFSRIHDEKHWASDVAVGAILGTVIAKTIYKNDSRKIEASPTGMIIYF